MATIVGLADAVVADLNSEGWSLPFVAQRLYRPRFDLAELTTLKVSVVPRSMTIETASRADDGRRYQLDLAIQQKLEAETAGQIDQLLGLAEEIARFFRSRRPASLPQAVCVKVENEPVYAVEHLDELQCFTSVIRLTFLVVD